jgi:quercetin 2,3-dioxygenase
MRTIKEIYTATYAPIVDLETYSPLPNKSLKHIDPFLLLNHHGPQKYPPNNKGLPFGPHPHRGMETVTFIFEGDIMHKDSVSGKESVINAGGIQWMTAGRGLTHVEQASEEFKENGGDFEVLQMWLNLPASLKMTQPRYQGLQKKDIPNLEFNDGKVIVNLISGTLGNQKGPFQSLTNVYLSTIYFKPSGKVELQAPAEHNIFFYVVRGSLKANNTAVETLQLVEFEHDAGNIQVEASADSILIYGHARPFNEPIVARGPFVMNSEAEIQQAYKDYREGKFDE